MPGLEVELDAAQSRVGDVEPHMSGTGDEEASIGHSHVCAQSGQVKLYSLAGLQQADDLRILSLWIRIHGGSLAKTA